MNHIVSNHINKERERHTHPPRGVFCLACCGLIKQKQQSREHKKFLSDTRIITQKNVVLAAENSYIYLKQA